MDEYKEKTCGGKDRNGWHRENWPHDIMTSITPESQLEVKVNKEVFGGARNITDKFDMLVEKFALRKTLRVCAWIQRFMCNSQKRCTTEGIEKRKYFWTAHPQSSVKRSEKLNDNRLQMNLQERSDGLLEYQGRIHITIPSYCLDKPSSSNFTKRSNQRNSSIPISGCRFSQTYEISEGKEERS